MKLVPWKPVQEQEELEVSSAEAEEVEVLVAVATAEEEIGNTTKLVKQGPLGPCFILPHLLFCYTEAKVGLGL